MSKPHLETAFNHWKALLNVEDVVIDATCGKGQDTEKLSLLVPLGKVYSLDIQEQALTQAKARVTSANVEFLLQSHITLPSCIPKLIVYNLGYLPGGDKTITTQTSTTLISLKKALSLLACSGAISLISYSGHPEGALEEKELLCFIKSLNPSLWKVELTSWKTSLRPTHPLFIWIQRVM